MGWMILIDQRERESAGGEAPPEGLGVTRRDSMAGQSLAWHSRDHSCNDNSNNHNNSNNYNTFYCTDKIVVRV